MYWMVCQSAVNLYIRELIRPMCLEIRGAHAEPKNPKVQASAQSDHGINF